VRNVMRLLVLVAIACAVLAGCKATSSPHPATSRAVASASAFATNPAIQHDQVVALRRLTGCVATATGGQLTFKVTTTTQGQASIPGTTTPAYPHVQVTHWSLALLHHMRAKVDAAINCAAPASIRASVKGCVHKLNLPTSRPAVTGYLIGVADCTVGAPQ
jgi:hypothetical protein